MLVPAVEKFVLIHHVDADEQDRIPIIKDNPEDPVQYVTYIEERYGNADFSRWVDENGEEYQYYFQEGQDSDYAVVCKEEIVHELNQNLSVIIFDADSIFVVYYDDFRYEYIPLDILEETLKDMRERGEPDIELENAVLDTYSYLKKREQKIRAEIKEAMQTP